MLDDMVTCTKCKVAKPRAAFHKSTRHKNGVTANCKECRDKYHSAYYGSAERKEAKRLAVAKYRAEHKAHVSTYQQEYYKKNRDKIKAYQKARYLRLKEQLQN